MNVMKYCNERKEFVHVQRFIVASSDTWKVLKLNKYTGVFYRVTNKIYQELRKVIALLALLAGGHLGGVHELPGLDHAPLVPLDVVAEDGQNGQHAQTLDGHLLPHVVLRGGGPG